MVYGVTLWFGTVPPSHQANRFSVLSKYRRFGTSFRSHQRVPAKNPGQKRHPRLEKANRARYQRFDGTEVLWPVAS
jgi:hypothetical protein